MISMTDDIFPLIDMSIKNIVLIILLVYPPLAVPVYGEKHEQIEIHGSRKAVAVTTDVAAIALPVATLAGVLIEKDWEGLKQGALTGAVTAAATLLLKYTVKEDRPDYSNNHSFPSGHTAVGFATATFLQRRYGWKFGVPAYIVGTYIAWGRVYSKKHHWWDTVAGAAIGAGSALIFTTPWAQKHDLQLAPSAMTDALDQPVIGLTASFTL